MTRGKKVSDSEGKKATTQREPKSTNVYSTRLEKNGLNPAIREVSWSFPQTTKKIVKQRNPSRTQEVTTIDFWDGLRRKNKWEKAEPIQQISRETREEVWGEIKGAKTLVYAEEKAVVPIDGVNLGGWEKKSEEKINTNL